MPRPQDEEFIRFAVAGGQLTQEQADEALAALREIEELGGSAAAPDILVNRGILAQQQADRLHQAIASSKAATKVPRELGGFELLEKLGQGGMGSVFTARQKELDRVVALKVLSPRLARNQEFVQRFLREARSAGRLNHPNIVAAIDVGESEGFYYFAMEYVDGETLADVLAREGRLPEARALAVATDVARALDHAHHKGLIHRDVKPANIMITRDGRVRVTDFGLARLAGAAAADADPERFVGTPAYAAPEQVRSEPDIDCRADIFALGVTLFQMLTGELPFQGANPMAIAAAILTEPLPPLRKLRPDLSQAAARVVEKMTAKDRAERFANPAEAIAALERAVAAPRAAVRAPSKGRPKTRAKARPAARAAPARRAAARRRQTPVGAYIGIAAAAIALLVAIIYLASSRREPPAPPGTRPGTLRPGTPPPPTPTTDAVAKALLDNLSKAVAEADQFAARNPQAYVSQMARLRKIRSQFARTQYHLPREGSALLQRVHQQLTAVEQQAQAAADGELKRRRTHAEARIKEGKFADAFRLLDTFPAELHVGAVARNLARLRDEMRRRALAAFGGIDAQGKRLIGQGSLAKAKELYLAVSGCGVPKIADRAGQALAQIDKLIAARGDEAERAARQAYPVAAKAVLDRLAARDYDSARKQLDAAIVDPKLAPLRDRLRAVQPLVRAAAEVWARVAAGLKKLKAGDTVRVAGVGGRLVRIEGGRIYIKAGAAVVARPLTDLRAGEAVAFAQSAFGPSTPQWEAKLALFLLADREYDAARSRLEAAKSKGADVAVAAALVARFSPRICPTCKDAKAVPCPECGGKGFTTIERKPCDACDGKGVFPCTKCRGAGRFACHACKGTGWAFKGIRCGTCGGRGQVKCPRCRGRGEIKCKKCKGTGELTRPIVCKHCKGQKTVPCPTCGSKGHFPPPDLAPPKAND